MNKINSNKYVPAVLLVLMGLLLFFFYEKNYSIAEVEMIPVPAAMSLCKTETKEVPAGTRNFYYFRGRLDCENLKTYFSETLPGNGWEIVKTDARGITADRQGVRARLIFHNESQQTKLTLNVLHKK